MKSRFIALFALVFAIALFTACNKEKDTIAEVKVVTPNGSVVPGAKVRMYGQSTSQNTDVGDIRIDKEGYTAGNGIIKFDFTDLYVKGQSGFAILNLDITKEYPDSTVYMPGIMKIEEETTNRKTFVLIGQ